MKEDGLHVHILPVLVVEVGQEAGHRLECDVPGHLHAKVMKLFLMKHCKINSVPYSAMKGW